MINTMKTTKYLGDVHVHKLDVRVQVHALREAFAARVALMRVIGARLPDPWRLEVVQYCACKGVQSQVCRCAYQASRRQELGLGCSPKPHSKYRRHTESKHPYSKRTNLSIIMIIDHDSDEEGWLAVIGAGELTAHSDAQWSPVDIFLMALDARLVVGRVGAARCSALTHLTVGEVTAVRAGAHSSSAAVARQKQSRYEASIGCIKYKATAQNMASCEREE
jgi:hypothetical protein